MVPKLRLGGTHLGSLSFLSHSLTPNYLNQACHPRIISGAGISLMLGQIDVAAFDRVPVDVIQSSTNSVPFEAFSTGTPNFGRNRLFLLLPNL